MRRDASHKNVSQEGEHQNDEWNQRKEAEERDRAGHAEAILSPEHLDCADRVSAPEGEQQQNPRAMDGC